MDHESKSNGWEKLGLVFKPNNSLSWQRSHAALPTAIQLSGSIYRIYYCSRDQYQRTHVGFFDYDLDLLKLVSRSDRAILSPGPLGHFDDHGVQPTSIVNYGSNLYLYYLGWNPGLNKPLFYTSIGLAISQDGGLTFEKYSVAPIMERSKYDPWMVSGGTVIKENIWRMWYISGISFTKNSAGASSKYDIKYAESIDGINWIRNGLVSIALNQNETNISRPSILMNGEIYSAWYPYKKKDLGYRIGYAESEDGMVFKRLDHRAGIGVSATGWDSQALDKNWVVQHRNELFMFYNGNSFGMHGIGLAVLKT